MLAQPHSISPTSMISLRFVLLLSLAALCFAAPTERTFFKPKTFLFCPRCLDNTVCAGWYWRKRCVVPMTAGERCGVDPYWVCSRGLLCKNNRCVAPQVPVGRSCLIPGSVCVSGTVCVGTEGSKICVKPLGLGGECGRDPFAICESGLECAGGICVKPKVPIGESCLKPGSVCVDDAICVGTSTRKVCKKPRTVGEQCAVDPFSVCEDGLDCVNNLCEKPKVPEGGDCLPAGSVCVEGTVCAGSDDRKKCVVPKGPEGQCGRDPFCVCEVNLFCIEGKCMMRRIALGGDCKPEGSVCEGGLFCLGDNGLKKCVKGVTAGQKCGLDPFWSCQPGLTCTDRTCQH